MIDNLMTDPLPDLLEIKTLRAPPVTTISVPGSKSITNRALVLAALAGPSGASTLHGALHSEDTEIMTECLRALGFQVAVNRAKEAIQVSGGTDLQPIPAPEAALFVGNSGTTMRFLTALVSLGHGCYRLDGVARMRERPIEDLLEALRQLGVKAYSERNNGYPPVVVETNGLNGGKANIRADASSQFLSGLLMAAPLARGPVILSVNGLVSAPYIDMTVALMRRFGVRIEADANQFIVSGNQFQIPKITGFITNGHANQFVVSGNQFYAPQELKIEPDASAASYFLAAAAITKGDVRVCGLSTWNSLQGDVRFVNILQEMGCRVWREDEGLRVKGQPLHGVTVDMNDISDCVMTLAVVALFAKGPTTIRNVAHIRHKETDRLSALATELRRVGARVEVLEDGLTIDPGPLHAATIETYNDHRMAMSMALVGLKVPGMVIRNPGCVAKTYPRFFEDLERLRIT
jgi:3-phosphoshikimate 1-carboxyvinyltransferase